MKLAYFTNTYPRATDTFIRREVFGLRAKGIEVLTYSVNRVGDAHDVDDAVIQEKANTQFILPFNILTLVSAGLRFLFVHPQRFFKTAFYAVKTKRPGVKGTLVQLAYFLEAIDLAARLLKDEVQHVHNHFGDNSGNVTLLAALLSGLPFSISIHGPHIFFDALYWALDVKARHAKFIAVIGAFCRSQMMLYTDKEDWHKLVVVRCGIEPGDFEYRSPSPQARKLLYTGRLDAEKGLPILFESLQTLNQKGIDVHLDILGDGADREYLQQLAVTLGIDSMVEFHGFVDQRAVADFLRRSDVFVLPSFAEGIPVAFMEAMAVGVPVIATNVGGVAELVEHNVTGLVCHASDSQGLADCIERYLLDPALRDSISRNARVKVVEEFSMSAQVEVLAQKFSES